MSIKFTSDLSGTVTTDLPYFWEHTVGSGHAPLALRADWQRATRRKLIKSWVFKYVRFHGIACRIRWTR